MKAAWATIALALVASAVSSDDRIDRLTPAQRTWFEQDVVYIITDIERETFLDIEASDVRDAFIEAFWRRRDPNPATLENEFQIEHYRRIEYANEVLGRETATPGWRTDRGRYYIILGEPQTIERYDRDNVLPLELWFYESDDRRGLPPFFYLLFFQPRGFGEYELYDHSADGPRALIPGGMEKLADNRAALEVLREVDIEVARAALSFDPSERGYSDGQTVFSGASSLLLASIEEAPKRGVRTDYIRSWKLYGARVGADYSFNFVPNRATFAVLAEPGDAAYLHYSVEIDPQNFNLETDEENSRYYTVVDLSIEVRTPEGELVVEKEREIPFRLTSTQFEEVQASPVAIQGVVPLVPGTHRVGIIARNRLLRQYTVAERDVRVGRIDSVAPSLTDVVLGYRMELARVGSPGEVRPFQIGAQLVRPAAEGVFSLGDTAEVLTQVLAASGEHRIRFRLVGDGETIHDERVVPSSRYPDGIVHESFALTTIDTPGTYQLGVELVDAAGETLSERRTPLTISPRTNVARAGFVSREGFNGSAPGLLALELSEQLLALGRYQEGVAALERAVAANNPDLPMARWNLAAIRIANGDAAATLGLLEPLAAEYPNQFEVAAGLGFAHYYQQRFQTATSYLEKALTLRPPYPQLLNALADCYQRTGKSDLAVRTFERSLELDPNQPVVRDRLKTLASP